MAEGQQADDRREQMVERTIVQRGVRDERVLAAMRTVPRERFVPGHDTASAYEDHPLPIGSGQTISQPYIVALMAEAAGIEPTDTVLEVGTGSGYGAAVLAELADRVVTVERHDELADQSRALLESLGIDNVEVVTGDGSLGWPAEAPYGAIVVTAAAAELPGELLHQLADGARLVIPIGRRSRPQELVCIERNGNEFTETDICGVTFVPLVPGRPQD